MTEKNGNTLKKNVHNGRKVLRALLRAVLSVILCLAVLDVALRLIVPRTGLLDRINDVQSAEMLHARLYRLRTLEGIKIAVLGDSLIYGRTMYEHGDKNWEQHTLPMQLERALKDRFGACEVHVMNLGMNGLLPSDLNELSRNVMSTGVDLIVFDLSLRSFSRDFENEEVQMSRPWLKNYVHTTSGYYNTTFVFEWNEPGQMVHQGLMNFWYLYRIKAHLQAAIFGGQPIHFMQDLNSKANRWFKGDTVPASTGGDDLLLLFKARSRYDKIDLDADNPQLMALHNLLENLTEQGQPFLSFYATENEEIRDDLMEPEHFRQWQLRLASVFTEHNVAQNWLGVLDVVQPRQYLDHVHLNKDGYKLLADELISHIVTRLDGIKIENCRKN